VEPEPVYSEDRNMDDSIAVFAYVDSSICPIYEHHGLSTLTE
jgi:hypothetical protein